MLSSLLLLIIFGYLLLCALLYVMQDSLIFHPSNPLSGICGTQQMLDMFYEHEAVYELLPEIEQKAFTSLGALKDKTIIFVTHKKRLWMQRTEQFAFKN